MKTRLEDYCSTLSIDEISKLISNLCNIKREKRMAEMNNFLDELETIFNKIEEKGYIIYCNGEIVHSDYIEIFCE